VAAGAWWYKNHGVLAGTSAWKAPAASATSQDTQTNSPEEAALAARLPAHRDSATAAANPDRSNAYVPGNAATASATDGEAERPEAVPSEEKKPVLGEVHLEAPKLSGKRTAQNSVEPDLSEEPSAEDATALGAPWGVSGRQPAAPAAQVPVGGEVKQARLISSVPPTYPAMAKAQHVSGGVTIDALVDANGRVTKMKVLSGPTLLEQAAMDALRQWKYEPATLDGKAVPMHLTVTIQFRLQR
jgi:TonB family protein